MSRPSLVAIIFMTLTFSGSVALAGKPAATTCPDANVLRGAVRPCDGNAAGVDVYIPGQPYFVRTGPEAVFYFYGVPEGEWHLVFERRGQPLGALSGVAVGPCDTIDLGAIDLCQDRDGDGFDEVVDCDDADPEVSPGAAERCDGKDNDCDGQIDEDWPELGAVCQDPASKTPQIGHLACAPDDPNGLTVCVSDGASCVLAGWACASDGQCCNGHCNRDGVCNDEPCWYDGYLCHSDADCCGGRCNSDGVCGAEACATNDQACAGAEDCCSGLCSPDNLCAG